MQVEAKDAIRDRLGRSPDVADALAISFIGEAWHATRQPSVYVQWETASAVVFSGALNALGWGIVVVYGFFTLGSGYLLLSERPFDASPTERAA